MIENRNFDGMDDFNFEDQSYMFIRKCNYADTIPMTWFNNLLINSIRQTDDVGAGLRLIQTGAWLSDWYSVITSVMEISYSLGIFYDRTDWYNAGKLTAKFTKLGLQMSMKRAHNF